MKRDSRLPWMVTRPRGFDLIRSSLRAAAAVFLAVCLSSCSVTLMPSESDPTCSWTTSPPANHDAVCKIAYFTLNDIAKAELRDDSRAIRRLVSNPSVTARILMHAAQLHQAGVETLHVTPSFTLGVSRTGDLGAGFNVVGTSRDGSIKAPQTVYLRIRNRRAVVVNDQPNQEW